MAMHIVPTELQQGLAVTDSPTFAALTLTNPLVATSGGTGHAVYAVGDMLGADTTTTLARVASAAAGKFVRAAGVGVMFAWSTLVLPNAATAFRLSVATAADTIGELAAGGAAGQYLAGATGAIPAWATLNQAAVAGLTTASSPTFAGLTLTAALTVPNGGTGFATLAAGRIPYGAGVAAFASSASLTFDGTSFVVATAGPHAIGGAANTSRQLYMYGSFTGAADTLGFDIGTVLTGTPGNLIYGLSITTTLVEAGSGTHALLAGLRVNPFITAGAAATTDVAGISVAAITAASGTVNASGIKIDAAPTGATNMYALWVDAGTTRLDGYIVQLAGHGMDVNGNVSLTDGIVGRGAGNGFDLYTAGDVRIRLHNDGTVEIPSLAGTGTRTVVASAAGVLSAP